MKKFRYICQQVLSSKFRPIAIALILWLTMGMLDVVSTCVVLAYIPGAVEQNGLMLHPVTGLYMPLMGVGLRLESLAVVMLPVAGGIYLATKNATLASIPVWYKVWTDSWIVAGNIALFIFGMVG